MEAAVAALVELRGSCNCGRNTYVIEVPRDAEAAAVRDVVRVVWDGSQPPYLRIPLPWYHSTTYAFYPDETHSAIRRVYHLPSTPPGQRHFCGYCGAKVSHWLEGDREKEWMFVDLETLGGESLVQLEGLGIPGEDMATAEGGEKVEEKEAEKPGEGEGEVQVQSGADGTGWFERVVGRSGGGRVRVSRGAKQEGRARVEWEVLEWTGDGVDADAESGAGVATGKRKLEEVHAEGQMEE